MSKLKLKNLYYSCGAAMTMGTLVWASDAHAAGNTFSKIAENAVASGESLPGFLTAASYLAGLGLGILGVGKIKAHVENPGNTPLKEGAIRLAAGGALFALPIVLEAMSETIDAGGGDADVQNALNKAKFLVN